MVLLLAAEHGLQVTAYTPPQVKQAVTGSGSAPKEQVGYMVKALLGLAEVPAPADTADALAVALCHLNHTGLAGPGPGGFGGRAGPTDGTGGRSVGAASQPPAGPGRPTSRGCPGGVREPQGGAPGDREGPGNWCPEQSGEGRPVIASLRGRLLEVLADGAVLEVGGVGYRVFLTPKAVAGLPRDGEVLVHTVTYVREDTLALYGFATTDERRAFEQLLTATGVGPKLALAVLAVHAPTPCAGPSAPATPTPSPSSPGSGARARPGSSSSSRASSARASPTSRPTPMAARPTPRSARPLAPSATARPRSRPPWPPSRPTPAPSQRGAVADGPARPWDQPMSTAGALQAAAGKAWRQ